MFQLYISQNQEDLSSRKKNLEAIAPDVSLIPGVNLSLLKHVPATTLPSVHFWKLISSHVSSLFAFQISQDKNLLHLWSPRANATFNNSVKSRTSATIFYSVSESNCFRIARAVTTRIWYINSWSGIYTVINLYILPLHRILTFLHVQDNAINICMHSL